MALVSSGTISIGGTTTNRSINLELGRSATATSSLNETALRNLAGVSSGTISLSNFYGKSADNFEGFVTNGNYEASSTTLSILVAPTSMPICITNTLPYHHLNQRHLLLRKNFLH